jgi:hypothetical protein
MRKGFLTNIAGGAIANSNQIKSNQKNFIDPYYSVFCYMGVHTILMDLIYCKLNEKKEKKNTAH